jgi:hypothetical protein
MKKNSSKDPHAANSIAIKDFSPLACVYKQREPLVPAPLNFKTKLSERTTHTSDNNGGILNRLKVPKTVDQRLAQHT